MDTKLRLTIDKIELLAKQNTEFAEELRKRLNIAPYTHVLDEDRNRIKRIEKYLGLDFYVDTKDSNVDYSFVQSVDVRNKLISDNREMMRFRYGTRYHEIDFDEFCRYAHFQIEMLINYYYDAFCHYDFNSVKSRIAYFNPKYDISKAESLGAISFFIKLYAFGNEHKLKYKHKKVIEHLAKVRNKLSHRPISQDNLDMKKYKQLLLESGIPLNRDGSVGINWFDPNADTDLKTLLSR